MTAAERCLACGAGLAPSATRCPACGAAQGGASGPASLVGSTIDDRFRVLRLLGTGGMGAVFLAEHLGLGRRIAIKLLRAELREHKELSGRFRREITAVSRLTDAHTITVFDSGEWRGLMYLVMEHLQGRDLAEALHDEGRLAVERAVEVACQICSSLAEAHRHGIIHRDLKPENIFLTRTAGGGELVKVLDFGLAKLLDPADGPGAFETQKGTLLGTPWYMAPEQIEGGAVGAWTDVYALGTLLYRMLTGRHAFDGPSPIAILDSHVRGGMPPMDPALGVPPALEAVVARLLARRPEIATPAPWRWCRPSLRGSPRGPARWKPAPPGPASRWSRRRPSAPPPSSSRSPPPTASPPPPATTSPASSAAWSGGIGCAAAPCCWASWRPWARGSGTWRCGPRRLRTRRSSPTTTPARPPPSRWGCRSGASWAGACTPIAATATCTPWPSPGARARWWPRSPGCRGWTWCWRSSTPTGIAWPWPTTRRSGAGSGSGSSRPPAGWCTWWCASSGCRECSRRRTRRTPTR
ncbi:MAG: serine/threonine-protein kinase [bacterium]